MGTLPSDIGDPNTLGIDCPSQARLVNPIVILALQFVTQSTDSLMRKLWKFTFCIYALQKGF
jgi:hypothetical protein